MASLCLVAALLIFDILVVNNPEIHHKQKDVVEVVQFDSALIGLLLMFSGIVY